MEKIVNKNTAVMAFLCCISCACFIYVVTKAIKDRDYCLILVQGILLLSVVGMLVISTFFNRKEITSENKKSVSGEDSSASAISAEEQNIQNSEIDSDKKKKPAMSSLPSGVVPPPPPPSPPVLISPSASINSVNKAVKNQVLSNKVAKTAGNSAVEVRTVITPDALKQVKLRHVSQKTNQSELSGAGNSTNMFNIKMLDDEEKRKARRKAVAGSDSSDSEWGDNYVSRGMLSRSESGYNSGANTPSFEHKQVDGGKPPIAPKPNLKTSQVINNNNIPIDTNNVPILSISRCSPSIK